MKTNFLENLPTFTKKTFTFNTPANLDVKIDAFNNFGVSVWTASEILVDDMSLVEIGPAIVTPSPTPIAKASNVTINNVTDKTTSLYGKTSPVSTAFDIKYGTTTKQIVSNASGNWTLKLPKVLSVGSKILLTAINTKTIYVGATAPMVSAVTTKSTTVNGKTYKLGVVTIKIGAKLYSVKASSKGVFTKKISKLKKGTKILVKVKVAGQTSPYKTIIVK